jgi:dihydrofolate synthase/folylpolyglutamate synthase
VLVDGAHTSESVAALDAVLRELADGPLHLAISTSRDRQPAELLAPLLARAVRVTATAADPDRSRPARSLAAALAEGYPSLEIEIVADPREAVRAARRALPADGLLCITGSMYLAGAARGVLADGRDPGGGV